MSKKSNTYNKLGRRKKKDCSNKQTISIIGPKKTYSTSYFLARRVCLSASTFAMTIGSFKFASTGAAASNCKEENHSFIQNETESTLTRISYQVLPPVHNIR
jgi:hypothetical protein